MSKTEKEGRGKKEKRRRQRRGDREEERGRRRKGVKKCHQSSQTEGAEWRGSEVGRV